MTWRVLWFLLKLGIIGGLAIFFATDPGRVSIDWQGYAIDMQVGIFALILLLLVLLIIYGERIRQNIFLFPGRWREHRKAVREMKGYRALTLGMVAVAAGDIDESRRQSRRAKDLLTEAPLTKLLQAQSAQLSGDEDAAQKYFEDMRNDPEVAFLGIRGLMTQAIRAGNKSRALELAEEARKLRPGAKWVLLELLDLQIEAGQWNKAMATLEDAERKHAISASEAGPIRAKLSVSQATRQIDAGNSQDALRTAQKALKAEPGNADAITIAAKLMHDTGKDRKAEKLIEDAWKTGASAALAESYRQLATPDTTALAQVKRFERLLAIAPEAAESHLALAEVNIDAQLWGAARTHLAKATESLGDPPPARLCLLWARLEESEHNDLTAAHRWLIKASEAEANPAPHSNTTLPARRDETLPV